MWRGERPRDKISSPFGGDARSPSYNSARASSDGRVRSTAAFRVHADSAHSLTLSSAAFCTATAPPQCWTYKTNQASDLKKMEKLNHIMSAVMTRGRSVDLDSLEEPSGEPKRGKR